MTVYRIRKKGTELYSLGGISRRFNKTGRIFKAGPLKCHFAQVQKWAGESWRGGLAAELTEYLATVEVVPFIVGEVERPAVDLADFVPGLNA